VETEGLGKAYRLYASPFRRILEAASLGRVRGHREFWALRDVGFAVPRGAALGICGVNGAGKSTLLRILAGTTAQTEGRFRTSGRVTSLLDLGSGFHMNFTGRANIHMQGVLLGYGRSGMQRKVEEIAAFAELGSFLDEPLFTYSTGMGLRLGFSVAMAMDPEVLILDEVLAVGDAYFQKKCTERIFDLKRRNKTILFCSHGLYEIRQLCEETIWLHKGRIAARGDSHSVTDRYYSSLQHDDAHASSDSPGPARRGEDLPVIVAARLYRLGTEQEIDEIDTGDSVEVRVWWHNPRPQETPIQIGIGFLRQDRTIGLGVTTFQDGFKLSGSDGCLILELPRLSLLSGSFVVPVWLMDRQGLHKYQEYVLAKRLIIHSDQSGVGVFDPEHHWRCEPLPPPAPADASV
jgi:ABC-type polysaccharide/polyol phosphate transport system ATPase subunit